ncbi:hypothetical protein AAFM71_11130 [Chromobacterium violaceum]|uniref:hypothetical protein n=1 Tax=Chromobacterium violaceum TaxID=536 RepID=UPI0012D457C9|nr:hypothetical protein [Chromobacterium violaceum]
MKVKCINLVDKTTGLSVNRNDWLSVGEVYRVIFIEEPRGGERLYRIIGDDVSRKPMLFDASQFEILDDIRDGWVSEITSGGTYRSGPVELMIPGFWGALFDGEPYEIEILNSVVKEMK